MTDPEDYKGRIADLERQNADLQAANVRIEKRARDAETELRDFKATMVTLRDLCSGLVG